ncbi:MAG: thymidine phosphorylase [Coraliomargarita sp.]|nr:thymidine phosphorylase [Coraliomargarita sp.]
MESALDIIANKRDGNQLSRDEIHYFIDGVVAGNFPDYQASALLMAILLNGMSDEETIHLTTAMLQSGRVVELPEITRPKVDKHSTGGVGDKVSLILAPLAAAAGLCVPMMSGRGLGHTGGTLDKLEAIPGFSVYLDDHSYRKQLSSIHQAMIGQSEDMVPADRILYALRDVTSTVESIPLICSSILSKKMAEGIDALVLDVKSGSGAFMKTEAQARELAGALVRIGTGMGKPTSAILTRMDQPLGNAVGNALEVAEVIDCLKGQGPQDLMEVTFALVEEMLRLGGLVKSGTDSRGMLKALIADGSALRAFAELIEAQGGDPAVVEKSALLPTATTIEKLHYDGETSGFVAGIDALLVGESARLLGAGRMSLDSAIDPAVGVVLHKKTGDSVAKNDLLAEIHCSGASNSEFAVSKLRAAFTFSEEPVSVPEVLIDQLS